MFDEGEQAAKPDAEFWNQRIQWARSLGRTDLLKEYFAQGLLLDPAYHNLFTSAADGLQRRWGGGPGELERAAAGLRKTLGGDDGDIAYAIFLCNAISYESDEVFEHTKFDYATAKPCFEKLAERYSENPYYLHSAALAAFAAHDQKFARRLFEVIGPVSFRIDTWGDSMRFQAARQWALEPRTPAGRTAVLYSHGKIECLDFSPDGSRLFSAETAGHRVNAWNVANGRKVGTWQLENPLAIAVHPRDKQFVVGGGGSDYGPLRPLAACKFDSDASPTFMAGHSQPVTTVKFSPQGDLLASGGYDKTVLLWKWGSRDKPRRFEHPEAVTDVAFSPDGKRLATSTKTGELRIWNLETSEAKLLGRIEDPFNRLAWSHDGKKLLMAGGSDHTHVWRLADSHCDVLTKHRPKSWSVSIAPDDTFYAAGLESPEVDVFDYEKHTLIRSLPTWAKVHNVAFSPNGKILAACCYDGTVHLWDADVIRREP